MAQLTIDLRDRLAKVAAGVWLDPAIVTGNDTLFVDYNTQFSRRK